MKEAESAEVANLITRALKGRADADAVAAVAADVATLSADYSPYPHDFVGHV